MPRLLINLPAGFFAAPQLAPVFARLASGVEVRQTSHDTQEQILADLAWAEAVIMWAWPNLTVDLLSQAPALRFAGFINATQTTVRACLARGIIVSEARRGWSQAVAEMALGLILSGLRRLSDYHAAMRTGDEKWVRDFPLDIDPLERELTGSTVGIAGFGGIGRRLAEFLRPFQVELLVHDPYLDHETAIQYGAYACGMAELARRSDVVVLCAANNEGARHLLGRAEIMALKPHSLLVNVGRSILVEMKALTERLQRGDLLAMLDVFDCEPLERDSPLRQLR
ncbi:MAG: NAD(P)-dependent oxidoreductase, partial [Bacteroidota bacterium]